MEKSKKKKLPYIPPQIKVVEFKYETWFPASASTDQMGETNWNNPQCDTSEGDNATETGFIDMEF